MFLSLFLFLAGSVRLSVEEPAKVANCLLTAPFSVYRMRAEGGRAHFTVLWASRKKALAHLSAAGLVPEREETAGLPAYLKTLAGRAGLLFGLLSMIILPLLSGRFLWQIDVVGNHRLSDTDVLAMLAREGVFEGAYVGDIDTRALANRCVMNNASLAWMALNLMGNRLEVDIVETEEKQTVEFSDTPSNVTAKKSGVIVRLELVSGVAEVREGQVVNEGALLISGVNLLRNGKYIYQPAVGRVFAETLNEITLHEPLIIGEKCYTGEVLREKTLIFFTKSKKIEKISGNLPVDCDRIETKERLMLFGKIPLPLWIQTVEYRPFVLTEKERSAEAAETAALAALGQLLARGELLSLRVTTECRDGQVFLTARYRLIEDIAQNYPLWTK